MGFLRNNVYNIVIYSSLAVWAYWTYGVVIATPWMIKTHGATRAVGIARGLKFTEKVIKVESYETKRILLPQWEAVKTFSLQSSAHTLCDDKRAAYGLDKCRPRMGLSCRDSKGRALVHLNLGHMAKTTYYHSTSRVWTPNPISDASSSGATCDLQLALNMSRPECLRVDNDTQFDLLWDIYIQPTWHWTDWVPREFAEDTFGTVSAINDLLGLDSKPTHWADRP